MLHTVEWKTKLKQIYTGGENSTGDIQGFLTFFFKMKYENLRP